MQKISEVYSKRFSLLNKLYLIYTGIKFQAQNKVRWTKYFGFQDYKNHKFSPSIHYTMLPNEICFDVDESDIDNLKEILSYLGDMVIPCIVGFSGSKGYHIHFLLKPVGVRIEDFAEHPKTREFTKVLTELLIEDMENVKGVDLQQVKHRKIRSFYSQHQETGLWKMPFWNGYEYGYPVWELSRVWYLFAIDKLREKDEEKLIYNYNKSEGKSDFSWVKPILENPERYHDGRRRLLMFAIIPYLINVEGLSDEDAEDKAMQWAENTTGQDNNFKGLIRSEIRSYKRSGYLPSKKSVEDLI